MQVQDVMTKSVVTTTVETPLRDAVRRLAESGISGMPVMSADGAVVGVISEADVLAEAQRTREDTRGRLGALVAPRRSRSNRSARSPPPPPGCSSTA